MVSYSRRESGTGSSPLLLLLLPHYETAPPPAQHIQWGQANPHRTLYTFSAFLEHNSGIVYIPTFRMVERKGVLPAHWDRSATSRASRIWFSETPADQEFMITVEILTTSIDIFLHLTPTVLSRTALFQTERCTGQS